MRQDRLTITNVGKRRAPLKTADTSTIIYPSAVFSLEKDETLPYERFAYNILHLAVEALGVRSLPVQVIVEFTSESTKVAPWTINASVQCKVDSDGKPSLFTFLIPELVPALIYIFCQTLGAVLVEDGEAIELQRLQEFVHVGNKGVRSYKKDGLGHGIRTLYDRGGLTIAHYAEVQNSYDLLTKLIAYHEIGHAYADHLSCGQDLNAVSKRGFELIADLLATTWFYNGYVRNTPDDEEYRRRRGVASYAESIFANAVVAQRTHLLLIALMAIAGTQQNDGLVTLEGGISHPPGLQRHMLQHMHLTTLIESNFGHVLSREQFEAFDVDWNRLIDSFVQSGLIPIKDIEMMLDPRECDTIEAAADAIHAMDVRDLKPAVPVLLEVRELLIDALAGKRPSLGGRRC